MEDITINRLELASELANRELEDNWRDSIKIYKDEEAGVTVYTEEAQDVFNDLYEKYDRLIEYCKS
jgi:hypothetical protein